VTGRLLGGNLEVLSRLCGTPLGDALLHSGEVVLLLEEVTEVPYRIDRALTQLRLAGLLDQVVAVVVGDLLRCEGPAEHPAALAVIGERLGTWAFRCWRGRRSGMVRAIGRCHSGCRWSSIPGAAVWRLRKLRSSSAEQPCEEVAGVRQRC
jgi:hypothetical protein